MHERRSPVPPDAGLAGHGTTGTEVPESDFGTRLLQGGRAPDGVPRDVGMTGRSPAFRPGADDPGTGGGAIGAEGGNPPRAQAAERIVSQARLMAIRRCSARRTASGGRPRAMSRSGCPSRTAFRQAVRIASSGMSGVTPSTS